MEDYVKPGVVLPRDEYRGPHLGNEDGDINPSIMDRYNFDFSNHGIVYSKMDGEYSRVQLNSADNYARFHLVTLVEKHRRSGSKIPLTHIILGCTHYPYHLEVLAETVEFLRNYKKDGNYPYRNVISKDFKFIDPAQYTAMECYSILRKENELALRPEKGVLMPYISIPAYGLAVENLDKNGDLTYDFKYGREVGTEDITTKVVPFSSRYIDQSTIERMARLVPQSYELFKDRL